MAIVADRRHLYESERRSKLIKQLGKEEQKLVLRVCALLRCISILYVKH